MQDEILNIDYYRKEYTIRALTKFKKKHLAAKAMGISNRTLFRWIKIFNIDFEACVGAK